MSHQDFLRYFDDHSSALLLFARQYVHDVADAEGVVQEAFVRMWKRGVSDKYPVKQQLYLLTKCSALDFLRSEKRRKAREENYAVDNRVESSLFEIPMEKREVKEELMSAIDTLPPEQREVLAMKIWGELTFREISEVLETSQGTVASRYRLALETLKKRMNKEVICG
jgi:RNA polymerase sigma-70 factor (ECF subfamily)